MALVHAPAAVRRAIQTAGGIARTIGNDVIARLLREEFTLFRVTGAGTRGTPTNDRRDNVLHTPKRAHALNYGGTTD
jgi:hypothetical protein